MPVVKLGRRRQRLANWMDSECFNLRRHSRRLEKRYRWTLSEDDRRAWVLHERHRHQIYRKKESAYWNSRMSARLPSTKLWRTVNTMIGCRKMRQVGPTAQQLLDFFNAKVEAVRQSTANCPVQSSLDPSPAVFDKFDICSEDEVRRTICSAQSKACELDPIPTDVMKKFLPELLPFITDMCNASLQQGSLLSSQRRPIVTPRLKKEGMDTADLKSYRSMSNLTFMSKTVEILVCRQLASAKPPVGVSTISFDRDRYAKNRLRSAAGVRPWSSIIARLARPLGRIRYGGPRNSARPSTPSLRNSWKRS